MSGETNHTKVCEVSVTIFRGKIEGSQTGVWCKFILFGKFLLNWLEYLHVSYKNNKINAHGKDHKMGMKISLFLENILTGNTTLILVSKLTEVVLTHSHF